MNSMLPVVSFIVNFILAIVLRGIYNTGIMLRCQILKSNCRTESNNYCLDNKTVFEDKLSVKITLLLVTSAINLFIVEISYD